MRWVFIRPVNLSPYYDPEIQEPLGIEYLDAARRRHGDAVLLLDAAFEEATETSLGRRAAAFMPDAVGFSMTTAQDIESVLRIHASCREALGANEPLWLAGGNFITCEFHQAARRLPTCFTLVRFEGEQPLDELARDWSSGVRAAPALIEGRGVVRLDDCPFPVRPYAATMHERGWAFNLQGSRGCCGACRYCSSPAMREATSTGWRGRSVPNVVDEIEQLNRRFGATGFNFVDEDFLGPDVSAASRARQFREEIHRRGLLVGFSVQVRPGSLSDAAIEDLAAAGLCYAFIGLESDDPKDFKYWGRPWVPQVWRYVDALQRNGVQVEAGAMPFHPGATLAGIRRFATALQHHDLLNYRTALNRMDAMPGSSLHRHGVAEGYLDPDRTGPQSLPLGDEQVRRMHENLERALAPLGPPSMHAVTSRPPLMADRRMASSTERRLMELNHIIRYLDAAVADTFFALLNHHEVSEPDTARLVAEELRAVNFGLSEQACRDLAKHGFVRSADELREAIRKDAHG